MSTSTDMAESDELTLGELEASTGVAARTIRYYQSEGLLPRPTRRGGKAFYGEQHLERLRTIASMQARGLRLQTIRQVLGETGEPSNGVVDILGPGLTAGAWLATSARTLDEGELADLLGECYPDQVPSLVATGYLERRTQPDGRKVWYAPSVPQMQGALELFALGSDFQLSRWAADLMRERLAGLCDLMLARWILESGSLYDGEGTTLDFERNLERIRAVGWQSAAHVMAEELSAAIHRADEIRARLEAGEFTPEDLGRA